MDTCLSLVIKELSVLYQTEQSDKLWCRILYLRDQATPIWKEYWQCLYDGLCPESNFAKEIFSKGRVSYQFAYKLQEVLSNKSGQEMAKVILRKKAPNYDNYCCNNLKYEARTVRVLGANLDPRYDADAARLLKELLTKWDIDQKSCLGFLKALNKGGLNMAYDMLLSALCSKYLTTVELACQILSDYSDSRATEALHSGIEKSLFPEICKDYIEKAKVKSGSQLSNLTQDYPIFGFRGLSLNGSIIQLYDKPNGVKLLKKKLFEENLDLRTRNFVLRLLWKTGNLTL